MRLSFLAAASWVAAAPWLAAQPALTFTEVARGSTCLGSVEVRSVPVEPSQDVVIAVLADTLRNEDWTRFRDEFTARTSLREPHDQYRCESAICKIYCCDY